MMIMISNLKTGRDATALVKEGTRPLRVLAADESNHSAAI